MVSELSHSAVLLNARSPSLQKVCNLLKILNGEKDTLRWQYYVEYLKAYNAFLAQTASGCTRPARINPNFVRENFRDVLMCSQQLEALTVQLRRLLPSATHKDTAVLVESTILRHIYEFQRFVDLFKNALMAYTMKTLCRPQAPTASQTVDCPRGQSMPDSGTGRTSSLTSALDRFYQQADGGKVMKALNDDVDLLLSQQQQQSVTVTSSMCFPVAVSTSSVVDGWSDNTRPLDSRVSCSSAVPDPAVQTINSTQQIDPPQTKTTNVDVEDRHPLEVKFSHVLQSRQRVQPTDLSYITIDDDDYTNNDSPLIDPCGSNLADSLEKEIKVACAVDIMSLAGFNLVPFTPTADCQPAESGARSVGSAGVSSDSGDSAIVVKLEQNDVIEDPHSPANNVISAPDQKAEYTDASLFVRLKDDDGAIDTNMILSLIHI